MSTSVILVRMFMAPKRLTIFSALVVIIGQGSKESAIKKNEQIHDVPYARTRCCGPGVAANRCLHTYA